jgi:hypothetical protein
MRKRANIRRITEGAAMQGYTLQKWEARASHLPGDRNPLHVPFDTAQREAARAILFLRAHWEPSPARPGLRGVPGLSLDHADELLSLSQAIQDAQLRLWMAEEQSAFLPDPREQAAFVLTELDAGLAFLLHQGLPPTEADAVASLRAQRADEAADLAEILRAYRDHLERLRAQVPALLAGVDLRLREEIPGLLARLAERRAAEEEALAFAQERRRAFYQLLRLQNERVQQIRDAASYVFRNHRSIVRKVTSEYARIRQSQRRKQKAEL